jgi:chromate transporter
MISAYPKNLKEIASAFLLLGTTFGGPAIMGIMQAEIQEKRQWVTKARLVEGLSLVTALPGATALQLGIFLGYNRGGWWGGLIAGLCFVLPAFFIMLALAAGYAAYGALPLMRGIVYGLGPVVVGVFLVAVYRLGRAVAVTTSQRLVAIASATALALTPLGVVAILALGGAIGLVLFHSRRLGAIVVCGVCALIALAHFSPWSVTTLVPAALDAGTSARPASLLDIGSFFLMTGALSFGGGLSLLAFIQQHVVNHYHWLTPEEFVAGLALGQLTPGPIIMVAAYVGYKLAGVAGAALATASVFLPSFVLMLSILPFFDRATKVLWTKAAMKGIGPAVLGVLAVSLLQVASHALRDLPAVVLFVATIAALLAWRVGVFKLMAAGAVLGALYAALVG